MSFKHQMNQMKIPISALSDYQHAQCYSCTNQYFYINNGPDDYV